ncbi:MAG: MutS family DNA mismatch repair protein [Pirellulaceae bacterium]
MHDDLREKPGVSTQSAELAVNVYRKRSQRFAAHAARFGRHDGQLVLARSVTFLTGVSGLILGYLDVPHRPVWIAAGTVMLVVFLGFAILDDWLKRRKQYWLQLQQVNDWQRARCLRLWSEVPVPKVNVPPQHAALAKDLDLFGRASLFHLINVAHTPQGIAMLRDWILEPAEPAEIRNRQASVKDLVPRLELREELALWGHALASSLAGPEEFVQWAEGESYLDRRPWIKWGSRLFPLLGLLAIMGLATGTLSPDQGGMTLVAVMVLNVLFSVAFTGSVHDIFDNISTRNGELRHYVALFELIASVPTSSPRLAAIKQQAVREEHGAVYQLRRLDTVMKLASLRLSALSLLYFVLQATVLWDYHVLLLLERWQKRCAGLVRGWFEALAELEALSSLASLSFDNPLWCFPEVDEAAPRRFQGSAVGHPLLSDQVRVPNDVDVGPAGTVLLVTGSNMSGKSTLLRAIGLNAILAETGGPACARSLQIPPLTVTTSMRIQDSLQDGVSFFMAELKRLKSIVDQATHYAQRGDRTLLYLLDEILQGTNSVERHLAVARVLAHLVGKGAIGAVSTHDLALAESPELADCCRAVHFRETLHGAGHGRQMTFDYQLRPGIATTTNALKLLEMVGLVEPSVQDRGGASE